MKIFKENGNPFWFLLSFLFAAAVLLILSGCAGEDEMVKKPDMKPPKAQVAKPQPQVKANPGINMVLPIKEVEVLHFYTFTSTPPGAGIYVIDTQSGKEVGFLGTTPVRILVLKKKVEIEGFRVNCTGLTPNVAGLTVAGKNGKVEQIEFQFKFKMQGYYDDMKIERLPLNTADSTEQNLTTTLSPIGGKK